MTMAVFTLPHRAMLAALAATLALAGCASMAPAYAPLPLPWRRSIRKSIRRRARADVAWQSYFADPRLQALIAQALASNRDIRIARCAWKRRARVWHPARGAISHHRAGRLRQPRTRAR